MTGYLIHFSVCTLAMIGVLLAGFVVAKKFVYQNNSLGCKDQFLSIESRLGLEPRKSLYVIKAGTERFLVSTDGERTNLLTKLEDDNISVIQENQDDYNQLRLNIPAFNFTKNILNIASPNAFKTRFVEKLNAYVTFQRP